MNVSHWISATRPKTLPAALAPLVIAFASAWENTCFSAFDALIIVLCAVLIQVATNFANDVIDFEKGSDTATRLGPLRSVQAGLISASSMWKATLYCLLSCVVLGSYLVYRGGWPIALIGISAICLALLYSATRWALSYRGTAEPFVLLYFGPIASCGAEWILCQSLSAVVFLGGCCTGLLSTAILVVNNLRDIESDAGSEKRTLAVRFGAPFARREFAFMSMLPALLVIGYAAVSSGERGILFSLFYLAPLSAILRLVFAGARLSSQEAATSLNEILGYTGKTLLLFSCLYALGILS